MLMSIPLWKKKEEEMSIIWQLIYELCINYEVYEGNIKFYELIAIYCVQWLIWSVKMPLIDSTMKYQKRAMYLNKIGENWATSVQVMSHWTLICLPWPITFIVHFKVHRMCILGQSSGLSVILNQVRLQWLWN